MRKFYVIIIIAILFATFLMLATINLGAFDEEKLEGDSLQNRHLSIIGEYIFYKEDWGIGEWTKAKNLQSGDTKIVSMRGLSNIYVYENEIYYIASSSISPVYFLYKKGINGFFEEKVLHDKVDDFKIHDNFLYYKKCSYANETDKDENGNIFRVNLSTKKEQKLINCRTDSFFVCNDKIYYSRHSGDGYDKYKKLLSDAILCYSLLSNTDEVIVTDWIGDCRVENNDIVYSRYVPDPNHKEERYELLWLNLETNKTVKVCDNVKTFELYDNKICYIDNTSLEEVNIFDCISNGIKHIKTEGIDYDDDIVLYNDKIYYYNQKHMLCVS